jgi:hypothetical protein
MSEPFPNTLTFSAIPSPAAFAVGESSGVVMQVSDARVMGSFTMDIRYPFDLIDVVSHSTVSGFTAADKWGVYTNLRVKPGWIRAVGFSTIGLPTVTASGPISILKMVFKGLKAGSGEIVVSPADPKEPGVRVDTQYPSGVLHNLIRLGTRTPITVTEPGMVPVTMPRESSLKAGPATVVAVAGLNATIKQP